ncbi:MAG: TolC family protein [Muribaculum sp.]|nr:TolC family protein [Muribaculum sp.]
MNIIKTALLATVLASISPLASSSQSQALTLEECLELAMNRSRSIRAGIITAEKAETLKGTAFDVEKTAVSLGQETGGGGPENAITVSQDFEFPTVYVARHKALKAEAELERSNLAVTRATVVRDVTSCYYNMLHALKTLTLREMQDSLYRSFVKLVDIKYAAGDISRLDQINVQRAYQLNSLALKKAGDEYFALCEAMAQLLDSEKAIIPADTELTIMQADVQPTLDFAATPRGEQSRRQVSLSERNLALTRQGYMPGISLSAYTQMFLKGFNPYHVSREPFKAGNFLGFEVGVTVPLFFGAQKAKTRAARQEVELAHIMQTQAERSATSEYRTALNSYVTAKRNVDYYRLTAMPQAEEIEHLSETSYRLGEIEFAEHIRNMESAMEIRLLHADAINEYNQIIIQLNFLQGKQ